MWNPDLSPQAFFPGLEWYWEWACWGCCSFPKPVSCRREDGFWVFFLCVFIQYVYNYRCFNLLKAFLEPSPSLRFLHGRDIGNTWQSIFVGLDAFTPIPVASQQLKWRGVWPTELLPAWVGASECNHGTLWDLCAPRARPAWRFASNWPKPSFTQQPGVAWLPWCRPKEPKAPLKESGGPAQACTTHSFKGLMLSELFVTKKSKGFGKKCNFYVGSEFSPDTTPPPPRLFNPFSTSKGKGGQKTCTALVQH